MRWPGRGGLGSWKTTDAVRPANRGGAGTGTRFGAAQIRGPNPGGQIRDTQAGNARCSDPISRIQIGLRRVCSDTRNVPLRTQPFTRGRGDRLGGEWSLWRLRRQFQMFGCLSVVPVSGGRFRHSEVSP